MYTSVAYISIRHYYIRHVAGTDRGEVSFEDTVAQGRLPLQLAAAVFAQVILLEDLLILRHLQTHPHYDRSLDTAPSTNTSTL